MRCEQCGHRQDRGRFCGRCGAQTTASNRVRPGLAGTTAPGPTRRGWWLLAGLGVVGAVVVGVLVVSTQFGGPGGSRTAEVLWQEQVADQGLSGSSGVPIASPQVSRNLVAVWVASDVLLLDRVSGQLEGSVESFGPPVLLDDHVAVQLSSGLAVYDTATQSNAQGLGPVRAVGGAGSLLTFHGPPGLLTGYDVESRGLTRIRWQAELPDSEEGGAASPVVIPQRGSSDGMVVTAVDRHVVRFATRDGQPVWSTGVDGPSAIREVTVAPDEGMVYARDGNENVTALALADGTRRWSLQGIHRPPNASDGVLVAQLSDGRVATFDAQTGQGPLWTVPGDRSDPAPVVSGGQVVTVEGIELVGRDITDGTELWQQQLLGPVAGITAGPDGQTFAIVAPGIVYAIDGGQVVWRTIGANLARLRAQPTIAAGDGLVIVPESPSLWQALDSATGQQLWTFQPDTRARTSSPNVSDAGVFFSSGGDLVALDSESGQERWRVAPGFVDGAAWPPVTHGDTVVVGMGPALLAVDTDTGDERWRHTFASGTAAVAATIGNRAVYATTADSSVLARLDLDTGEVDWQLEPGPELVGPPVVAGRTVVIRGTDGTLRGFDADTGQARWRAESTVDALGAQTVRDRVFVLEDGHTVAAFNVETGAQEWAFAVDDQVLLTAPVVVAGTIVVATSNGTVYGMNNHGTQQWQLELASPVVATPSAAGEQVFVSHVDGRITALTAAYSSR